MDYIVRPEARLAAREFDVVIAGGGTAGVFAAIAAARGGAKTAVIEAKGYIGGIAAEGGCGLHSFYNNWSVVPGTEKRKVIRGIPEEFINRLTLEGGASGHNDTIMRPGYDADTLCVDVEKYKYVAQQMLREAGVCVMLNTMVTDVLKDGDRVTGVITDSHGGSEAVLGKYFIDATGYGDLCARAGASYTEPNDHPVANSMGVGGIDIDKYYSYFKDNGGLIEVARGPRSGRRDQVIRVDGRLEFISKELQERAEAIGMSITTTTLHDDYLMFIKLNYKMDKSPTDRDAATDAEYQLRHRQNEAIKLLRETIPGAKNCFIARSAPAVTIRRGRCIECDYDMPLDEIVNGVHFDDDVYSYGFHDCAPRIQIKDGKTFGMPYRAMLVKDIPNLFATGMMITSDWTAHMSTRNTVSCMAMGQASGTAAALCCRSGYENTRELPYPELYGALKQANVWFDAEHPYEDN